MKGRSNRKMTYTWYVFYGVHEFHMSLSDILATTPGEMVDLINCLAVFNGVAKEKNKLTYDQVLMLR